MAVVLTIFFGRRPKRRKKDTQPSTFLAMNAFLGFLKMYRNVIIYIILYMYIFYNSLPQRLGQEEAKHEFEPPRKK